jgi:type VI secretion system secreted protein VgrG
MGLIPSIKADYSLNSAAGFAVLGNTTVTSVGNTALTGNLGVSPGTTIVGFGPGTVSGTTYAGGPVAQQAQADALAAYNQIVAATPLQSLTGQDLGGLTLTPGIYNFTSSAQLTGILKLNAMGNPNAQFIFQIGSTLNTASGASVVLENGAEANSVAWQIGSSATLGTGTTFAGNILAEASVTLNNGASLTGSAIALNGAVSLDDNQVGIAVVPEPNSLLSAVTCAGVLGGGFGVAAWRRRNLAAKG